MNATQTIAIIGASGNMGGAIAKSLVKGNYNLLLQASQNEKVTGLVSELVAINPKASVEAIDCSFEASWEADIIILAVPYTAEKEIAEKIKEVANQKIVISISNPLNETFDGLLTTELSAAEELQLLLPNAKVIKAFNTTFQANLTTPVIKGEMVDAFVAGNDEAAIETVSDLVKTAGFTPIVAGDLTVSRTLEQMQLLLIKLTIKNNYNWHAGWRILLDN
ncbi:dinucleotide-binding protein [Neptunitalea chrysea]|uniref:Dinucleotide-binding protein n=1 Tax=Neptunitalea chrysea TaxID=1647581 RepID=A0A9W6EWC3_9FLAO|nr:NAD(P)-binding domain-containing protein [Neptunitalea chrysea]GLB52733.1 dinucleotide-binding protein [Neptunitalea chrysea]